MMTTSCSASNSPATLTDRNQYAKLRKPKNARPGWYKLFANGLQSHYDADYLEVRGYNV